MKKRIIGFMILCLIGTALLGQAPLANPWKDGIVGTGMQFNFIAKINGEPATANDVVIAVVAGQIRENRQLRSLSPHYPTEAGLSGYLVSTTSSNDRITFQLWSYSEQVVYLSDQVFVSEPGGTLGSPAYPIQLNFNERTHTIRGRVVREDFSPIAGMSMYVSESNPLYNRDLYTTLVTNSQGYYWFPGIKNEAHIKWQPESNFIIFFPEFYNETSVISSLERNFRVDGYHPTYDVKGFVRYNGFPISGVSVGTTFTNHLGWYSYPVRQNTDVQVLPQKRHWTFTPVNITPIVSDTLVHFNGIPQMLSISGRTGTVEGVMITYTSVMSGGNTFANGAGGLYTINNIVPGDTVIVKASKEGYRITPDSFRVIVNDPIANLSFGASPIPYSISGRVRRSDNNAPMVGLWLSNGVGQRTWVRESGVYSFSGYYGDVMVITPDSTTGFRFDPPFIPVTITDNDSTNHFFAIPLIPRQIKATVYDNLLAPFEGVEVIVSVSDGTTYSDYTDSTGVATVDLFQTTTHTFTVTPEMTGYTFTPQTFTGLTEDKDLVFYASIKTYDVNGSVGVGGGHIVVTIGDSTFIVPVNSDGTFIINDVEYGTEITLEPYHPGYNFDPASETVTVNDDVDLDFDFLPIIQQRNIRIEVRYPNGNIIPNAPVTINDFVTNTGNTGILSLYRDWGTRHDISVPKIYGSYIFNDETYTIYSLLSDTTVTFESRLRGSYTLNGHIRRADTSPEDSVCIVVTVVGDDDRIERTDDFGYYEVPISEAEIITISPIKDGREFSTDPPGTPLSYTVSDSITVNFTSSIATYTVSGNVHKNGTGLDNIPVVFGADTLYTHSGGYFAFTDILHGSPVTITPYYEGHEFTPEDFTSHYLTVSFHQLFEATPKPYKIRGKITNSTWGGQPLPNVRVYIEDTTEETFTNSDGDYELTAYYQDYPIVVPYLEWHSFTPAKDTVLCITTDVEDINFSAIQRCPDVLFSMPSGTYSPPLSITLSLADSTEASPTIAIYYSVDGGENYVRYFDDPIVIATGRETHIVAKAVDYPRADSDTTSARYTVYGVTPRPHLSLGSTVSNEALTIKITARTDDGVDTDEDEEEFDIYYTLDGTLPTMHNSHFYADSLVINRYTTLKARAFKTGYTPGLDTTAVYEFYHTLTFNEYLPEDIYLNQESQLTIDFRNYIKSSVIGWHNYIVTAQNHHDSLNIEIEGTVLTISPQIGWTGSTTITFDIEYDPGHEYSIPVDITANYAQCDIIFYVNPDIRPVNITGYFPEEKNVIFIKDEYTVFYVNVVGDSLSIKWYVDNVEQENDETIFDYRFGEERRYDVKVVVSNRISARTHSWIASHIPVNDTDLALIPLQNTLIGNYPNPFNPSTTIEFGIRNSEIGMQNVTIDIYNIKGQKVRSIVNDMYRSGKHSVIWNGTDDSGRPVSSGIYFYRMKTDNFVSTKKMILMK